MHFEYAPGPYLLYAPGALCIQICSWSIFDLEYDSRLFMLLEQLLPEQLFLEQLLLEHNLGPKSHKSVRDRCIQRRVIYPGVIYKQNSFKITSRGVQR